VRFLAVDNVLLQIRENIGAKIVTQQFDYRMGADATLSSIDRSSVMGITGNENYLFLILDAMRRQT
jgi:hypothetical protein